MAADRTWGPEPLPQPRRGRSGQLSAEPMVGDRRRVVQLVPARTPEWVLIRVLRDARTDTWRPIPSAHRLLGDITDGRVLRRARSLLRRAGEGRMSPAQARALATLNVAVGLLEDREADADPDARGPGEGPPAPRRGGR